MTKSKNTKRALLASVLSMMLCLAMLVGSTFAWFTDNVTSGKNQIVAGNLDVELEYRPVTVNEDGTTTFGEWTPVDPAKSLFKPTEGDGATLWEPGHTEYVKLRIRNAGTLALKYNFALNVFADEAGTQDEIEYTNKDGGKFKLSDYLVFNKAAANVDVTKRENLWIADKNAEEAAMGAKAFAAINEKDAVLLPNADKAFTLAVYMPTWVGNVANYKVGTDRPEIYLGLSVIATQTPHESDSFGDNYDSKQSMNADKLTAEGYSAVGSLENLEYNIDNPNASNPEAFITSSGKLFLNNDIDQTVNQWIFFSGESTTLDLNGHYQRETLFIDNGTNLTITDSLGGGSIKFVDVYNGTVTLENCDTKLHQGNGCIFAHEGGTVIINGGEHNPMLISAQNGGTIIINDGKFNSRAFGFQTFGSGTITVNGGTFIFDVANTNNEGIILGEGKQCVDNGDGTWSVE